MPVQLAFRSRKTPRLEEAPPWGEDEKALLIGGAGEVLGRRRSPCAARSSGRVDFGGIDHTGHRGPLGGGPRTGPLPPVAFAGGQSFNGRPLSRLAR